MADGLTTQTVVSTVPDATKIATDDCGAAGHVQLVKLTVPTDGSATPLSPLTDAQLRATAVPVSVASLPSTAVTGPLTDAQLRATAVPVSLASAPTTAVTGPLTDAQLRAADVKITLDGESVPVTGTFFQATQPVSGTVAVSGVSGVVDVTPASPAANDYLPIRLTDGTTFYTASGGSGGLTDAELRASPVEVDGSGVTQPVSAASLPLPTGASTSAKQDAQTTLLGAGLPAALASDRLKVDGSGVTQPVSGTFWQATQPVSAAALPLPSGASTAAKQPALGTAGTASADVLTVQGVTSMTPLLVNGSGVTQPVSGTFWQATQPVSVASIPSHAVTNAGTFAVQNTAATPAGTNNIGDVDVLTVPAPLSTTGGGTEATALRVTLANDSTGVVSVDDNGGSITVDGTFWQATQPVSGTFWQATQPVSAASLPLPSGASTAAKQPALGTAGTASADVLSVQGVASMTALKVDGSAVTQPVSGTFWQATQPVSGTFWQATQPVSAASLPLPSGASTAAKQPALGTAGTASADVITVQGVASMTALKVDGSAVTQPVSGTFWQATQPVSGTFWQATQPVSIAATVTTKETRPTGGGPANVSASATSVTLIASNANRLGATIWNDSSAILYVKLGATASATSCHVKMVADAYYEVPFGYTGVIDGIWASATGSARVGEMT